MRQSTQKSKGQRTISKQRRRVRANKGDEVQEKYEVDLVRFNQNKTGVRTRVLTYVPAYNAPLQR